MTVFGRSLPEYLRFQRVILALIVAVGLARLGLSLAGAPNSTVRWASLTAVSLLGVVYYGVAVPIRRFGSYQQLLPLLFFQEVTVNAIAVLGIVLAAAGRPNIFASPEYGGGIDTTPGQHVAGHVLFGTVIAPLIGWLLSSMVLFLTRKVAPRDAAAAG